MGAEKIIAPMKFFRLFAVDIPTVDEPGQESDQKDPEDAAAVSRISTGRERKCPLAVEKEAKEMGALVVYDPTPLRLYRPPIIPKVGSPDEDPKSALSSQESAGHQVDDDEKRGKSKSLKRKGKNMVSDEDKGKSVKKRRKNAVHHGQMPEPIPDIPVVLQEIVTDDGSRIVFLCTKTLKESDVKANQNRLFLTDREKLMEFLTDEEREIVADNNKAIEVVGVDSQGKLYKLHLKKWPSLKMLVLITDWIKLVLGNNASTGDLVDLWGYRSNGQLHLAVHFRKSAGTAEAQRDADQGTSHLGG